MSPIFVKIFGPIVNGIQDPHRTFLSLNETEYLCTYVCLMVVKDYLLKLKHTLELAHHFVSHSTPRYITIIFFSKPKRMVLQVGYEIKMSKLSK